MSRRRPDPLDRRRGYWNLHRCGSEIMILPLYPCRGRAWQKLIAAWPLRAVIAGESITGRVVKGIATACLVGVIIRDHVMVALMLVSTPNLRWSAHIAVSYI